MKPIKTFKTTEENIEGKFHDISVGKIFLDMTLKTQVKKAKIVKWNYFKLKKKNLYTEKETINRIKKQSIKWKKIFANSTCANGLISKIYKEYPTVRKKKKLI